MKELVLLVLLGLLAGCGGKGKVQADTRPFATAIAAYLREKSMDVKVNEFKSLEVKDEAATALVKLTAADETIAQIKVRWVFSFRKQPDGSWKAVSHQVK